MRVIAYLLLMVLSVGCSKNDKPDKPITDKQKTQNQLIGTWLTDCSVDFETTLYQSLEERYTATSFELITTLHNSNNCSDNAIAREVIKGTYELQDSIDAKLNVPAGKNEDIKAWKIDYTVEDVELSGNKLVLLPGDPYFVPGNGYYNSISLNQNIKYDGDYEQEQSRRPLSLDYSQSRSSNLINATIQPPPVYDTQNSASQFMGNWYDECYNDIETDGAEEFGEESLILIADGNTITFETTIWTQEDCGGSPVATLALIGTYNLVDVYDTTFSNAKASVVEIQFTSVDYNGTNQMIADKSMPYAGAVGGTFYMLMFYEQTYDLLFYGGFLEDGQNLLPEDFDWVMTRIN